MSDPLPPHPTLRGRGAQRPLFRSLSMGGRELRLLELDHPEVSAPILQEMGEGFAVYYDQRWGVTRRLCELLLEEPAWTEGREILLLGVGVGAEGIAAALRATRVYLNDLSPVALELSRRQLLENGVAPGSISLLPGDYSRIPLPRAELAIGSYIVYDDATREAMLRFLQLFPGSVLLMNGEMPHFSRLLKESPRRGRPLLGPDEPPCFLFEGEGWGAGNG